VSLCIFRAPLQQHIIDHLTLGEVLIEQECGMIIMHLKAKDHFLE
jgi:hypothetical protein